MKTSRLWMATALVVGLAWLPSAAQAWHHHRYHHQHHYHRYAWGLPYPISYLHNYGPGPRPESFAYYDGPSTNLCYRGAAAYIGQDGQRHPCF